MPSVLIPPLKLLLTGLAGIAILLWIGIVMAAQAFSAVPREHAPAVVVGLLPGLACWGALMIKAGLRAAGAGTAGGPALSEALLPAFHASDVWVEGAFALEQGVVFSAMILSAATVAIIERQFVRAAIMAYFGFLADEHESWLARRPPGEAHPHVQGETPEMTAVFDEVRAAIVSEISRGGPAADPDYLAAACIAIAREVGGKMLQRRPIDTRGAADFAVTLVMSGIAGLPKSGH